MVDGGLQNLVDNELFCKKELVEVMKDRGGRNYALLWTNDSPTYKGRCRQNYNKPPQNPLQGNIVQPNRGNCDQKNSFAAMMRYFGQEVGNQRVKKEFLYFVGDIEPNPMQNS